VSFRIEEKTILNRSDYFHFLKILENNNIKKMFPTRKIQSLYFDNSSGDMFRDSIEGSTPRKKIRIRNYPNNKDNSLYLEIKISSIEGRFKTSQTIQEKEFHQFKKIGIFDKKYGVCRPQIYVSYDREYFQLDDVRIVVDQNINYLDFRGYKIEKEIDSIVEIKTEFNKNRDDLINDFPFQRIRFSKYCNGYNKLYNKNHK